MKLGGRRVVLGKRDAGARVRARAPSSPHRDLSPLS
jgi:hypothetical protein